MAECYLVTGGAGFVGSHLCERLLGDGHRVVVLDDLSTGREGNIRGLLGRPGLEIVRDTVENEQTVNTLMAKVDRVFHLASAVGVQLIVDRPVQTIKTIIRGTEVVLESAYRFNRPVLITSSSEVYGKGARVPFHEDDDVVIGPTRHSRWCYAYSKGIDEFLGLAYHQQFNLPVVVVRLFNTVGPRQVGMYGMVLPRFVEAALRGETLKVFGTGEQTRCFCHVSDVVEALMRLMHEPKAVGSVYNVGSDAEVSINALAARVVELAGSTSGVEHLSYEAAYGQPFDDLLRRVPALDKIQQLTGWRPQRSLDEIIQSVIGERKTALL